MTTKKKVGIKESGCCKPFDGTLWDNKTIIWKNKLFLKDRVLSLFHIPINMGQVITRDMKKIECAGALSDEQLMLSDENSLFGADIYIAVNGDVPGAQMVELSGTFLSKVFEGDYKNMGNWIKQMNEYVKSKKKEIKKMYFFYTMCPACAKFYGKNYTVILAQIEV